MRRNTVGKAANSPHEAPLSNDAVVRSYCLIDGIFPLVFIRVDSWFKPIVSAESLRILPLICFFRLPDVSVDVAPLALT